jgi:hypothetical protein
LTPGVGIIHNRPINSFHFYFIRTSIQCFGSFNNGNFFWLINIEFYESRYIAKKDQLRSSNTSAEMAALPICDSCNRSDAPIGLLPCHVATLAATKRDAAVPSGSATP